MCEEAWAFPSILLNNSKELGIMNSSNLHSTTSHQFFHNFFLSFLKYIYFTYSRTNKRFLAFYTRCMHTKNNCVNRMKVIFMNPTTVFEYLDYSKSLSFKLQSYLIVWLITYRKSELCNVFKIWRMN